MVTRTTASKLLQRVSHPAWLGTLRRTTPLSNFWGFDRGTPVDRYYIERFLEQYRNDIRGRVLEIKENGYTIKYGHDISVSDVLDIDPANSRATIRADLTAADMIPGNTFDCFILTQTLQLIYDVSAAIKQAHRLLRPKGILLVTVPVVSRIVPKHGLKTDYWRFTVASCNSLFSDVFGPDHVTVKSYGNVLTSIGFLAGMASEEFSRQELEMNDDYFPLIVTIRATKL